jgi:hypothetical protein
LYVPPVVAVPVDVSTVQDDGTAPDPNSNFRVTVFFDDTDEYESAAVTFKNAPVASFTVPAESHRTADADTI